MDSKGSLAKVRPSHHLELLTSYSHLVDVISTQVLSEFKSIDPAILKRDSNNVILFVVQLIEAAMLDGMVSSKVCAKMSRRDLCMDVVKKVFPSATADELAGYEQQLTFIVDTKLAQKKSMVSRVVSSIGKLFH